MVIIREGGFEPWMSWIYQEMSISWAIKLVAKQFILFDCKLVSDCKLCHSTSKPISDEEDILKSFMAFDITPRAYFRVVVGSQDLACETNPFFVVNSFRITCKNDMRWNCIISYNN